MHAHSHTDTLLTQIHVLLKADALLQNWRKLLNIQLRKSIYSVCEQQKMLNYYSL